jgi:hypothetical protein
MIRLSVGLIVASLTAPSAFAGDAPEFGPSEKKPVDTHCAALGEGFFAVAGSSACVRITGRISAGAGFAGPGPARALDPRVGGGASGFDTRAAVSGDIRFDTEAGPARIYVGVQKDTNPRWRVGDQ